MLSSHQYAAEKPEVPKYPSFKRYAFQVFAKPGEVTNILSPVKASCHLKKSEITVSEGFERLKPLTRTFLQRQPFCWHRGRLRHEPLWRTASDSSESSTSSTRSTASQKEIRRCRRNDLKGIRVTKLSMLLLLLLLMLLLLLFLLSLLLSCSLSLLFAFFAVVIVVICC